MTLPSLLPVILSGGAGSRLWPVSRKASPKQFQPMTGARTLFAETLARCAPFGREALVVCGQSHVAPARAEAGGAALSFLIEPSARNTGPAVAAAALSAPPETLLLVLPSDHHVADPAAFQAAVAKGARLAARGYLVTFGITPAGPETGFGYIQQGASLGPDGFAVARFVEKPDRATALSYLASGGFSWNAGIFLFQAGALAAELARTAPGIHAAVTQALAHADVRAGETRLDAVGWDQAEALPIDIAVIERTGKAAVVPVDMGWSDVGSWGALWQIADKDKAGNAVVGDAALIDVEGCYVRGDGPAITLVGVRDLIVVATPQGVFIAPRERAQEVKSALERLVQTRPDLA